MLTLYQPPHLDLFCFCEILCISLLMYSKQKKKLETLTDESINLCKPWVNVFRIILEFRILRPTFHRKSASNCWIRQNVNYSFSDLFSYSKVDFLFILEIVDNLRHAANFYFEFLTFRILENFELSPMLNQSCQVNRSPWIFPACVFYPMFSFVLLEYAWGKENSACF